MNRHVDAEMLKHKAARLAAENSLIELDRQKMRMDKTLMTPAAFKYFEKERAVAIGRQLDREEKVAAKAEWARRVAEDSVIAAAAVMP